IGTEEEGKWNLIDHSDKAMYWGKDRSVNESVVIEEVAWEHKKLSMEFKLPGLTAILYKWQPGKKKAEAKAKVSKSSAPFQGAGGIKLKAEDKAKSEDKAKVNKSNSPFQGAGGIKLKAKAKKEV